MKRLFEVNGEFFDNKVAAKAARGPQTKPARTEKVNGRDVHLPPEYQFVVRKGPDHWVNGGNAETPKPAPVKRTRKKKVADPSELGIEPTTEA